jgi:hypothetical protein
MTTAAPAIALTALSHHGAYDLLGYRVAVASNSADCIAALDRLNAEFPADGQAPPHAIYEIVAPTDGRTWLINCQGKVIYRRTSLMATITRPNGISLPAPSRRGPTCSHPRRDTGRPRARCCYRAAPASARRPSPWR